MSERREQEIDPGSEALGPVPGVAATIADLPAHQAHPPSRMAWSLASIVLLLVSLAIFIWTGIRGVDYGVHWDEAGWQIEPVKTMVKTGILLPPRYIYPSFNCWLNLGAAIPDILQAIREAKTISPGPEQTRGWGSVSM